MKITHAFPSSAIVSTRSTVSNQAPASETQEPRDTYAPRSREEIEVPPTRFGMLQKVATCASVVGVPALLGAASSAALGGAAQTGTTIAISLLAGGSVLLSSGRKSAAGLLGVAPFALAAAAAAPFLALPGQLGGFLGAAGAATLAGAIPLFEKGLDAVFGTKGGACS